MSVWAGIAAFGSYFCMYMYRKPYTAAMFEDMTLWGVDYKIVLVVSQVIGYAMAKFTGIVFISGMKANRRIVSYALMIGIAQTGLIGLNYLPEQWGTLCLLLNGLALGMVWGIVFQFLEGRRITEILTVVLSANFIITSGISKSIGRYLIQSGIDEKTMPMLTGFLFIPVSAFFLWMLSCIPRQNEDDIQLRAPRTPMSREERSSILKQFGWLIFLFTLIYMILTMVRDVRDNFGVEIWNDLGFGGDYSIYTTTELPVTLLALFILGILYRIRDNFEALRVNILLTLSGCVLLVVGTSIFKAGYMHPVAWMILTGGGLFIPYIIFNGILFDRLIGAFRVSANVGFFMYIVDAFGYLCSVLVMLYKNFGNAEMSWSRFYIRLSQFTGSVAVVLVLLSGWLLVKQYHQSVHLGKSAESTV
jgi:hypothetical protein